MLPCLLFMARQGVFLIVGGQDDRTGKAGPKEDDPLGQGAPWLKSCMARIDRWRRRSPLDGLAMALRLE